VEPRVKKNLWPALCLLLVMLIMGAAGAWWWMRRPTPPAVDPFTRLPGGFVVAWQADWASMRRSPLVRQALSQASQQSVDPAHLARLDQADWVSGVILPGGKSQIAMDGPGLSFMSVPGASGAARQISELPPHPERHDFWMVVDPRATGPLTIGPVQGMTVELPSELVSSARWINAYGKVGALSFDFTAEAAYASPDEAARLASSLNGFLGLLRKLALRGRNASTDETVKLFWDSLEVKTDGGRLLLRARLDEITLARMLILAGPRKQD